MSLGSYSNFGVFLSHSGQQKSFVRNLYDELQRANYNNVFFDQDTRQSLPIGSHLLETIINAIRCCKLGVVVISEGFITLLWPMMELQHLIAFTPECTIYPIFYELQPGDLVKKENLKKWQKCWKGLAKKNKDQGYPINIHTWREALQHLKLRTGTVIPIGTSEQTLYEKRREIILQICNLIPPPLFYNDPLIKGKESTAQAIQDHYKRSLQQNTNVGALVLGVAGIGGSGKTTLCETMVDYYNHHEFPGRSVLLGFPTHEVEQEKLLPKIKFILETITMAPKCKLERIFDIKEGISVFIQSKKVREYFLAIDNVWEWSEPYINQILECLTPSSTNDGTITKPKVLVTSRSEVLLERMKVTTLINVPTLKEEEALDILLSHGQCWELYKSKQISFETQIKTILNICYMNYAFHPLLLKTLGNIMKQVIQKNGGGWEECINHLKKVCLGLGETTLLFQGEIESNIFKALKLNYGYLEENLKNAFIDITILYPHCINLQKFGMLKDYKDIGSIEIQVARLENYGLIWRVERDLNHQIKSIEIHDLYQVLAKEEAKRNGRFLVFLDGKCNIVPSSLSKVSRILRYYSGLHQRRNLNAIDLKGLNFSELQLHKVELLDLHTNDIQILYDAWRDATTTTMDSSFQWLLNNVNDHVKGIIQSWNVLPKMNDFCLDSLSILKLECGNSITRLDMIQYAPNLQSLELKNCHVLKDIKGVQELKRLQELILDGGDDQNYFKTNSSLDMPNLSGCLELKTLSITRFDKLKSLSNLHCPFSLQRLRLSANSKLVDVGDIGSFGHNLVNIHISCCDSIKEIPCGAFPKLEYFDVHNCKGLEVMMPGGVICDKNFPCLETLSIEWCQSLKLLPPIVKTSGLQNIYTSSDSKNEMNCIFNLSESKLASDITELEIIVSREQMMFLNSNPMAVSRLTNLEHLEIKLLTCDTNIPRSSLSFLSELHGLRKLGLEGFDFITSLEELFSLKKLCSLYLKDCMSLRRLPHNLSTTYLDSLDILGCPALENFQDFLNSCSCVTEITWLRLDYDSCCCSTVIDPKGSLDLSNLNNSVTITLAHFPAISLSNFKWPKSVFRLRLYKYISQYGSQLDLSNLRVTLLEFLSIDSRCLMNLCIMWPQKLNYLEFCISDKEDIYPCIKSLRGVLCPTSLKELNIEWCTSLEEMPDLSGLTNLQELTIRSCKSLEGTLDLSGLVNLQKIHLEDCPSLELPHGYIKSGGCKLNIQNYPHRKIIS